MWSLGLGHRLGGRSKVCIGDHRTRSCHSQVFGEEDTRSHRASCPGVTTLNPETQSVLHSSCSRGLVAAIFYIALSTKPCGRILASLLVFSRCLLRNRCSSMELCSTTSCHALVDLFSIEIPNIIGSVTGMSEEGILSVGPFRSKEEAIFRRADRPFQSVMEYQPRSGKIRTRLR